MNDQMQLIEAYEAKARAMRAEAFGKALNSAVAAVTGALQGIGRSLTRWSQQRRAYEELMALDDRQLRDMGLSRSEIASVIAGTHMPETAQPQGIAVTGASANANERPAAPIRRVA